MLKSSLLLSLLTGGIIICTLGFSAEKTASPPGKGTMSALDKKEQEMEAKIRTIISQKGDVNQSDKNIPLLTWAVENKYVNCVKLLLENKANTEIPPTPGSKDSPLFSCSSSLDLTDPETEKLFLTQEKSCEIMQLLISHKADVKHKNILDETPLHKAALAGRDDLCTLLISAGADVNAQDKLGNTPLHKAAHGGYFKVVNLLLSKGAKSVPSKTGKTPLDIAELREDEALYKESRAINKNFYSLCDYDQTVAALKKTAASKTK